MTGFEQFFKGKKITVMGLGLLGRGVGDAAFLAECGAELTVTDLKTKEQLKESLQKLKKLAPPSSGGVKNIKYVLGEHRLEDFQNADMILKAAGVPLDSIYIKEARKNNIPIEMSASLFAKLSDLPIIGVTGTRGKSTVTHFIAHILESAGKKVILGGNVRSVSNLQLLKKFTPPKLGGARQTDMAIFELDSWQLQGFGEAKISPHISVFTNFLSDHLNYYKNDVKKYFTDKSYIYKFQNKKDTLVLGPKMKGLAGDAKGKVINANIKNVPKSWKVNLSGDHNLENIACAIGVARILKIKEEFIKKAVENFKTLPGRLQMARKIRGVSIYNDTNSTTADALIVALKSFSEKVILIMGGMDKGPNVDDLAKILPTKTKYIFLTPGSGGDKIDAMKINAEKVSGLKEAVAGAMKKAEAGDIILFSPGFASFNMFKNEYDRGDQFMKIVKSLK
ncbi:UDP-N-acetylmuramoylalanine--D-glutamate ligase [Candidatus Nomurabacteria bacterium RIFCSPLOWO2_02_FULL_40_10]|uniref:UDP-N-acetylmuramoylalanine--D-glutamate ligase n=1 Tax=Candidatus Nomurabacteria bacterium RIFCSPLOWO2_02_FULL_40_10 TaxID=1801786 RepID=A0A1F6Y002_9BACT|nr:MAG: UDP-N-acetylmuramoylalanine--D-glutamate ligase [Candidatus Nomurabacteria bacterium RIFCSPLOWO2_02_FULL_40_10]